MANLTQAVLTWNANTELDLTKYRVYFSQVLTSFTSFIDVNAPDTTLTISSGAFTNDGVWYFTISALDSSNNESAKATAVSKRIVRTQGVIRHKR